MASLSFTDFLSWALKNLMGLARATVRSGCIGASWDWCGVVPGRHPHPTYPQTILSCPTLEVGLRRRRWSGPPTCPGVRYIVLQLQEDKKGGHGKGQVALAMQAQMVVACWAGRDGR